MENFIYSIPTEIYFGKGQVKNIAKIVKQYGERVLLVYGGGSIKKNGIYDDVVSILKKENIYYNELSGVEPNPRVTTVSNGVKLCRDHKIDVILPIGGGS
ncbi:MAG: iron-containing alcohol dehydrogenase, partial [Erysipelotrichaceae bacterium]